MPKIIKYFSPFIFIIFISSQTFSQYYYNQFGAFDGTNDYLSTPSHQELNLDTAFTIEGWILIKDTTGFNKTILSNVDPDNKTGIALLVKGSAANPGTAGMLQLNLNGVGNIVSQPSGTRLSLNVWTHFAVTFKNAGGNNSDTIRFYLNGAQVLSLNRLIEPIANSNDSLRIGNCYIPGNYSHGLNGYLDDIKIYKTRRLQALISNDRGVPVSFEGITNINQLSNSRYAVLTASWTFNGSGNDRVGNQNNLRSNNGAIFINYSFNPSSYRNQSNYYIRCNGSGWLSAPDSVNSSYDMDTACTLEAWVYLDSSVASNQIIISKGNNYKLGITGSPNNNPYLSLNSGSKVITSISSLRLKQWYHLAATYKSTSGKAELFINGQLNISNTFTPANITTTNDSLLIGKSTTGEFLFGKVDEVRINRFVKSVSLIQKYLHTSLDNLNGSSIQPVFNCYGFEGSTLDYISQSKPLIPRGDAFFEWVNAVNTAAGSSEAPLIRTSLSDSGYIASFINSGSFAVRNNATVRDSININMTNGSFRIKVAVLLAHTYMDDVDVSLRAPNGTTVNLSLDNGGSLNDMITVFTDVADSSLTDINPPFSMRIKPQSPLSAFTGINPSGYWRLTVVDDNAANVDSGRVYRWGISFDLPTNITSNLFPAQFKLNQNYPNPFNPVSKINYEIAKSSYVRLKVYDALGREVVVLVNQTQHAGSYEVDFDGSNHSSGIYFYTLEAEDFSDTKRMILLK